MDRSNLVPDGRSQDEERAVTDTPAAPDRPSEGLRPNDANPRHVEGLTVEDDEVLAARRLEQHHTVGFHA